MDAKDAEKIRELLNFSGYPFQHYSADRIAKLDGFQLAVEVPFTHPPSNAAFLGTHGSIDILAACPNTDDDTLVWFVIECKKANDKIKNWILLPNKQQDPRWPTFSGSIEKEGEPLQLSFGRDDRFPNLGYHRGTDFDYCVSGIEVNTDLRGTNHDTREKIYNPLKQVTHALRGLEVQYPKIIEGIEYPRQRTYIRNKYLPVVLTTANLFVADFPVGDVVQGEIPADKLSLDGPKKWATYEFALPDFLSYTFPRSGGT